jgi:hypothetical protein
VHADGCGSQQERTSKTAAATVQHTVLYIAAKQRFKDGEVQHTYLYAFCIDATLGIFESGCSAADIRTFTDKGKHSNSCQAAGQDAGSRRHGASLVAKCASSSETSHAISLFHRALQCCSCTPLNMAMQTQVKNIAPSRVPTTCLYCLHPFQYALSPALSTA